MPLQFTKPKPTLQYAKVLLIGDAGSGKTHAALTFPRPAVIDAEGSINWFADRFDFISVATKSYRDVTELLQQIRSGRVDCDTVVIDSLTSIYNGLVNAATADQEDLRPLDWGRIKRKFSGLLDELYHKTGKHVVCIGWVKSEYAKKGDKVDGRTIGANEMFKLGDTFDGDKKALHAFDFVFRLEAKNGKHFATVLKSRSGGLREGQRIEDFSFATIANLIPKGAAPAVTGMTDEEQVARDRGVLRGDTPRETVKKDAPERENKMAGERPAQTTTERAVEPARSAVTPANDENNELLHRAAVERVYEVTKVPKTRAASIPLMRQVALEVGVEPPPERWGAIPTAKLEQFVAKHLAALKEASSHTAAASVPQGVPKTADSVPPMSSDVDMEIAALLAAHGIPDDDGTLQEEVAFITTDTEGGVRYDWHSLTPDEKKQFLERQETLTEEPHHDVALL